VTNPNGNLFDRSKSPIVPFKVIGTRHVMKITEWPSLKDAKNFETGQIDRWPDGSAKKIILVPVSINGEAHALWVTPGTALFAAIEKAQQDAGAEIAPGGTLTVAFTHEVPSSKGAHFAPAKQYEASYSPASAFAQAAGTAASSTPAAAPATSAPQPQTNVGPAKQAITAEAYAALSSVPGMDMSNFIVLTA
jgi:hypothetical protein